ncbi:MAG: hypothetical protein LBI09_00305 [Nitrososphaerota archaeon]|nr:hypothetical protein [Nitrososphaerota archaeon]
MAVWTDMEKAIKISDEKFQAIEVKKKETFEVMIDILMFVYQAKHKRSGRHAKLSIQDMLFMPLKY